MYILLLLALATAASSEEVAPGSSSVIIINGTCYSISQVLEFNAPFRKQIVIHKIAIQRSDNKLYYTFEPEITDPEYFKIGFIGLDNQNISGIISAQNLTLNFGAFDIDQNNGIIYLGGDDGVFSLDVNNNKLGPYSSRGDSIRYIFYKNNVYFSKYEGKGIVVKKGDNFHTLLENLPIKMFVINKYDIIVFLTNFGLFVGKEGNMRRISQNAFFRGLAMDLDGNIYAWWIDGIYKVFVDKTVHDAKIEKLADLPSIGSLTFDNENNILFTVDKGLYRLKANCTLT